MILPRCSLDHCMVVLAWRNLLKALHTSEKTLTARIDREVQSLTACCNHLILQAYVFLLGRGCAATR